MALSRQKFTFERLRRFTLPEGKKQTFLWDADVTTLACRATSGAKAFVFQSVYAGKTLISANLRVEPSEECDASVPR